MRIHSPRSAPPGWIRARGASSRAKPRRSSSVFRYPDAMPNIPADKLEALATRTGHVNPKSPITVLADTPVIARLDGGRGFGQVVARRGMEMAIAKAKANGLSAVTLANTTHVGRLADYAEMAAAQGLVGMLWVNAVFGLNVAPWGGAARRLGTNPHAIAVPGDGGPAMVLDFATSVVAEGK